MKNFFLNLIKKTAQLWNTKYPYKDFLVLPKKKVIARCVLEENIRIHNPRLICDCQIGKGTYIADSAIITQTQIGRFCSIGPNLVCGYGIHPTNGLSTSPCFYSTFKQNSMTYTTKNKIEERKKITIGNDVFIGMNVSILDGVTIGDGAIIGAGAVVTKDIPPYAVALGVPAMVRKYRFDSQTIEKLLKIKWWNGTEEQLKEVERLFFDTHSFVQKYDLDTTS